MFPRKRPKSPLFPKMFFNVPLKEMPNCSIESTLIPSPLEIFAHITMFPLIKFACSLAPHIPWKANNSFKSRATNAGQQFS